jgi:hypothetical protein
MEVLRMFGVKPECLDCDTRKEFNFSEDDIKGGRGRCRYCIRMLNTPEKRIRAANYNYKINKIELEAILNNQMGMCAICKESISIYKTDDTPAACIDHDHETGKVRGLLCHSCNIYVGSIEKNVYRIIPVLKYLRIL